MPDPPTRRWYQMELKDLFLGMACIAVGISMLNSSIRMSREPDPHEWIGLELWLLGATSIGAGIAFPFRMPVIGAVIGFFLQIIVSAAMVWIALQNSDL